MGESLPIESNAETAQADADLVDAAETPESGSAVFSHEATAIVDGPGIHWLFLVLSIAVITASFLMRHESGAQVFLPTMSVPLPDICAFKNFLGIDCPGCGLTRSFINISHGKWSRAWAFNPTGFLLYLLIAIQIPWQSLQLTRNYQKKSRLVFPYVWTIVIAMIVVMFAQWTVKLLAMLF